jgi:hypothetical protein
LYWLSTHATSCVIFQLILRGARNIMDARNPKKITAEANSDKAVEPAVAEGEEKDAAKEGVKENEKAGSEKVVDAVGTQPGTPRKMAPSPASCIGTPVRSKFADEEGMTMTDVGISVDVFEAFLAEWEKVPAFSWAVWGIVKPDSADRDSGSDSEQEGGAEVLKRIRAGELEKLGLTRDHIGGVAVSWSLDHAFLIPLRRAVDEQQAPDVERARGDDENGDGSDPLPPEMAWDAIGNPNSLSFPFVTHFSESISLVTSFSLLTLLVVFVG